MPFYEYRRPDGTTIEVMQKMTDPPLTVDPDTGVPLERVFHPIAVHFKGKGFYNTDYGTKKRAREKAEHEGAKTADKSDSSSGDSKGGDASSGDSKKQSETVSRSEPATKKPPAASKTD